MRLRLVVFVLVLLSDVMGVETGRISFNNKFFYPFFFMEPYFRYLEVTVESVGNFEDYIRFLSCHLFSQVNHGQHWKGWERSVEKGFDYH